MTNHDFVPNFFCSTTFQPHLEDSLSKAQPRHKIMATAIEASIGSLFESAAASLDSAISSLPTSTALQPPANSISLLDTKNELLLSYLQNLVFHLLLQIRQHGNSPLSADSTDLLKSSTLKLVELRLFLEKGVRPLEGKLKYQLDKVLRAVADAEASSKTTAAAKLPTVLTNDDSDMEETPIDATSHNGSNDLSHRPNPSSLLLPASLQQNSLKTSSSAGRNDGIYRPPRITPTSLPTTTGPTRSSTRAQPKSSATLDEYINTELSTAPLAEPSIGTTITSSGRGSKSAKERAEETERRVYEESNFVRLPKESKKDRKGRKPKGAGYGGEDWRGLESGFDRIEKLVGRRSGGGGGSSGTGALERSRKRRADESGDTGAGGRIGEQVDKKRRALSKRSGKGRMV
jgi:U3 small nucleolar ribonucleoprotein protein LCP5